MFEARHLQHNIVSGYIQIVSDGHHLPAFWSHPEAGAPFPGLVMIHDQWGLTPHVRSQARRFAEQGYYVIAPDLFNRQTASTPQEAQVLIDQVGEAATAHVKAALHALKTHHKCNGKIGLIGWGMGGNLALKTAIHQDNLRGSVMFYNVPGEDVLPSELLMLSSPLLAVFAGQDDQTPREDIDSLRQTLEKSDLPHKVITYEDVGRDFLNDTYESFDADTAEQAWNEALAFLNLHLDVEVPDDPEEPDEFHPGRVY